VTPELLVALEFSITMRICKVQDSGDVWTGVRNCLSAKTTLVFDCHTCRSFYPKGECGAKSRLTPLPSMWMIRRFNPVKHICRKCPVFAEAGKDSTWYEIIAMLGPWLDYPARFAPPPSRQKSMPL
jgi:hypothetical protein